RGDSPVPDQEADRVPGGLYQREVFVDPLEPAYDDRRRRRVRVVRPDVAGGPGGRDSGGRGVAASEPEDGVVPGPTADGGGAAAGREGSGRGPGCGVAAVPAFTRGGGGVYDRDVFPLVDQVLRICRATPIRVYMCFQLSPDAPPLFCTSRLGCHNESGVFEA